MFSSSVAEESGSKLEIKTTEQYSINTLGQTILTLKTHVTDGKKSTLVDTRQIKLKAPKWITQNQLWHLTDIELREIQILAKENGLKKPNASTVKKWKQLRLNVS